MKMTSAIGAAGLALVLAAAPLSNAGAQTKGAITGPELQAVLAAAGLSPTMTEDAANGFPVAKGMAGQFEFYVRALDCSGRPKACSTLMFFANFSVRRGLQPSDLVVLNKFNEKQVFGRAFFIEAEQKIGVDYVIELDGGVTMDHLARNVSRWTDVIAAFFEHMRSSKDAS
ncbi:MAG: YbjN domain-containing protein [Parvularculaceae bacterium]